MVNAIANLTLEDTKFRRNVNYEAVFFFNVNCVIIKISTTITPPHTGLSLFLTICFFIIKVAWVKEIVQKREGRRLLTLKVSIYLWFLYSLLCIGTL